MVASRARHAPATHPPSATAGNVDMRKGTTWSTGVIEPYSADKVRVSAFHSLYRRENYPSVAEIYAAVAIQIIHPVIAVVVDDDVGCVAKLMAAVPPEASRTSVSLPVLPSTAISVP